MIIRCLLAAAAALATAVAFAQAPPCDLHACRGERVALALRATITRSLRAERSLITPIRSSTCPFTGRITISGSIRPVGRITCST